MYSLDRIVNDKAILLNEQNESLVINISLLPSEVKEGDILYKQNECFVIDKDSTKKKQEEILQKLKKLSGK